MKKAAQHGFTLIELLIAIVIVVILTGVAVSILDTNEYLNQSKDARRISDILNAQTAIINSIANNDIKFISTSGCTDCNSLLGTTAVDGTGWLKFVDLRGNGLSGFIQNLPKDPDNGGEYVYSYYSDGSSFELNAKLKSEKYLEYMSDDGGNSGSLYERGFDLTLN